MARMLPVIIKLALTLPITTIFLQRAIETYIQEGLVLEREIILQEPTTTVVVGQYIQEVEVDNTISVHVEEKRMFQSVSNYGIKLRTRRRSDFIRSFFYFR